MHGVILQLSYAQRFQANAQPQIGSEVFAEVTINIVVAEGGVRIEGKVLTIIFPAKAEIEFNKFPLDCK